MLFFPVTRSLLLLGDEIQKLEVATRSIPACNCVGYPRNACSFCDARPGMFTEWGILGRRSACLGCHPQKGLQLAMPLDEEFPGDLQGLWGVKWHLGIKLDTLNLATPHFYLGFSSVS